MLKFIIDFVERLSDDADSDLEYAEQEREIAELVGRIKTCNIITKYLKSLEE